MANLMNEASLESFNSILNSFSSQASEVAVNVVNNMIEDQVADPKILEKNIARVKSVFSCKNLFSTGLADEDNGGGDFYYSNSEKITLLTLPRKVRQKVWNFLDDKSVKTLRLVCESLRYEMDYNVGLTVVLGQHSFHNLWMRTIAIRSCVIKQMDSMFILNNFYVPEKLQRLSIDPDIQMDIDMTELMIRKFRNLQQLIIYTEDVLEVKNNLEEGTPNINSSSKMISRLEDQFRLTAIDVKFDTSKWKLKWNIKMKPQVYQNKYVEFQDIIGSFGFSGLAPVRVARDLSMKTLKAATISIPFVQDRDRYTWLTVLRFQNVMTSLTCDLNATHWKDYEKIIRGNHRTLQKLFLLNITCSPDRTLLSDPDDNEIPFDWKMFECCKVIEEITLIAETILHSSASKFTMEAPGEEDRPRRGYILSQNLDSLTCPLLRAIWLENFQFCQTEMEFLRGSSKNKPRFEICTLKNCKLNGEAVSEAHLGLRKERNRSLECLCFGTIAYDDDDLENFEKYTAKKLEEEENLVKSRAFRFPLDNDMDMIECFRMAGLSDQDQEDRGIAGWISDNTNLLSGIAFTAWLYFC